MKLAIISLIVLASQFIAVCNNNKKTTNEKIAASNISAAEESGNPVDHSNIPPAPGESQGLVGNWKLFLDAYDDNGNGKLDPDERKKAKPNRHSYQFKPDGSCVIMEMFKGRYEVKKDAAGDKLFVYREKVANEETTDPEPEIFRILSVSKEELILLLLEAYDN